MLKIGFGMFGKRYWKLFLIQMNLIWAPCVACTMKCFLTFGSSSSKKEKEEAHFRLFILRLSILSRLEFLFQRHRAGKKGQVEHLLLRTSLCGFNIDVFWRRYSKPFGFRTLSFDFVHTQDFIHTDIKPENLLMKKGDVNKCYLSDVGTAAVDGHLEFGKDLQT